MSDPQKDRPLVSLSKEELKDVFGKIIKAVKPGGYIYSSFKYGVFEGYRNGRYFTDFTLESFHEFLETFPELILQKCYECFGRNIFVFVPFYTLILRGF